jgi:hypothetical protein
MSTTTTNGASKAAAVVALPRPIQAIDLVGRPEHRALWRSAGAATLPAPGLPGGGQASPLGYWLAGLPEGASPSPGAPVISFRSPTEPPAPPADSGPGPGRRPPLTVRVKPTHTGDGDLILVLSPTSAQVHATPAAWQAVAEPVLLAICQYWRFAAVDAELDRLTALAHGDIGHAAMPGLSSLRDRRRLADVARDVRALLVDLPHFEGPLTDPLPYLSTERAGQTFETLAEKLHLEEWCELIDERAEAVEDTYEAVTEKLFEYKNFAAEALLEVLIVVILLAELAFMGWEAFGP